MAHGLRSIVNSSYTPYGSGRDYFFIGDFQYRNGRNTPDINIRWKEEQKGNIAPKKRPRGEPCEVSLSKSIFNSLATSSSSKGKPTKSMPNGIIEKLRRQQSEPTCNDMLFKGSTKEFHVHRWRDSQSSKRPIKATRCLRRGGQSKADTMPNDGMTGGNTETAYAELGRVHTLGHNWSFSEFGAPEKHRFHSSFGKVNPPPKEADHPLAKVDDHMKEIPGKQSWPPAQAAKFYQNALEECERPLDKPLSKSTVLEWGHPAKHHHWGGSNMKIFAPKVMSMEQPERPSGWRPPEWGMPDKHRYHQPPLYAPQAPAPGSTGPTGTISRIPPGKECEIPSNYEKGKAQNHETMVKHRQFNQKSLYL